MLNKRETDFFFLTLGALGFILIFTFFIYPIIKKTNLVDDQISSSLIKLNAYKRTLGDADKIKEVVNKFALDFSSLEKQNDPVVSALTEIERISRLSELRLIDIRPIQSREIKKEVVFDLRTEGKIEDVMKFINNIENSLYLFEIKKFQLNTKPKTDVLECNFSIAAELFLD